MSSISPPQFAWTKEGRYEESLRYTRETAERNERYRAEAQKEKNDRAKLAIKRMQADQRVLEEEIARVKTEIAHLISRQFPSQIRLQQGDTTKYAISCFFCAEHISSLAKVCWHCRSIQPGHARDVFVRQRDTAEAIRNVKASD